jgi:hypothetical protein
MEEYCIDKNNTIFSLSFTVFFPSFMYSDSTASYPVETQHQNDPSSNRVPQSYRLRLHGAADTDQNGLQLIEEYQIHSDGTAYVRQHRIAPNRISHFVRDFTQHRPNTQVEEIGRRPNSSMPPSQNYTGNTNPQANHPPNGPFSTSSIGGLDGYDKYGSSFSSFSAVQPGRAAAANPSSNQVPHTNAQPQNHLQAYQEC